VDALIDREMEDRPIEGAGTSAFDWRRHVARLEILPTTVDALVPRGGRAVIVAPHPDDEVLGTGGLIAQLARRGRWPLIVAVTDGGASHARSSYWTRQRLASTRPLETAAALAHLGMHDVRPMRLGLPDGRVRVHEQALVAALLDVVRTGDTIFAPCLLDGHPDHEATGRAASAAATAVGATCVQVPIWMLHRARPDDPNIPWRSALRLPLDAATVAAKRAAAWCFRSQIEPDPASGAAPVLDARMLARWLGPDELYFRA
jgi:LmbE family N-acetylglucosaminyl deacetylase